MPNPDCPHDIFFTVFQAFCLSLVCIFAPQMKQGFLEICAGCFSHTNKFVIEYSELILRILVASVMMLEWFWKDMGHEMRGFKLFFFLKFFISCPTSVHNHSSILKIIRRMTKFSGVVKPLNFVIPRMMPELLKFPVWARVFLFEIIQTLLFFHLHLSLSMFQTRKHSCSNWKNKHPWHVWLKNPLTPSGMSD